MSEFQWLTLRSDSIRVVCSMIHTILTINSMCTIVVKHCGFVRHDCLMYLHYRSRWYYLLFQFKQQISCRALRVQIRRLRTAHQDDRHGGQGCEPVPEGVIFDLLVYDLLIQGHQLNKISDQETEIQPDKEGFRRDCWLIFSGIFMSLLSLPCFCLLPLPLPPPSSYRAESTFPNAFYHSPHFGDLSGLPLLSPSRYAFSWRAFPSLSSVMNCSCSWCLNHFQNLS